MRRGGCRPWVLADSETVPTRTNNGDAQCTAPVAPSFRPHTLCPHKPAGSYMHRSLDLVSPFSQRGNVCPACTRPPEAPKFPSENRHLPYLAIFLVKIARLRQKCAESGTPRVSQPKFTPEVVACAQGTCSSEGPGSRRSASTDVGGPRRGKHRHGCRLPAVGGRT